MIEVYVSTYERYVLGYRIEKISGRIFELSFRIHSAASSLRCLATNGTTLACGSSDECIYFYDTQNRKELGPVRFHSGTVNCMDFFKQKVMLSGGSDGSIALWDCSANFKLVIFLFRFCFPFCCLQCGHCFYLPSIY